MKKICFLFLATICFLSSCKQEAGESTKEHARLVTEKFDDGTAAQVIYKNADGLKTKEERFHPNGQVHIEGSFDEAGKRHGFWNSYYADGTPWSINFYTHGAYDKEYTTYFPNGQINTSGSYTKGQKTGKWTFYNQDGSVEKEVEF